MISLLLDAPEPGARTYPIARLGEFHDRRYGKFQITREMVEEWKRKLAERFNGRVPIDPDHRADRGGSTEAYGWITGLDVKSDDEGEYAEGTVEWTPKGEQAIREKRYLYVSPTFAEHHRDEQGKDLGHALIGAGMTNRPFLKRGMPALTLDEGEHRIPGEVDEEGQDERYLDELIELGAGSVGPAARAKLSGLIKHYMKMQHPFGACVRDNTKRFGQERAERICATLKDIGKGTTRWRGGEKGLALAIPEPDDVRWLCAVLAREGDSPDVSEFVKTLAAQVGLGEDATEEQVAERVKALAERPDPGEGKVTLDEDAVKGLMADAKAGREAREQLREQRFTLAFDAALADGKVDAKDETRASYRKLYDAVPDETLKLLSEAPKGAAFPAKPRGEGGGTAPAGEVPGGEELAFAGEGRYELDEERADLAARALAAVGDGELTLESFERQVDKLQKAGG